MRQGLLVPSFHLPLRRTQENRTARQRSGYHRRLRCEPLEDRRLLSFDVAGWTEPIPSWTLGDDVIVTGAHDGVNGFEIDVYMRDLQKDFSTPSEWVWGPDCFGDPLVDLSDLHTGFETGWSFSIYRSDFGSVHVYDVGYQIAAQVLDQTPDVYDNPIVHYTLPAATSGTISSGRMTGQYGLEFSPSFDASLEPEAALDANLWLDVDISKTGIPLAAVVVPIAQMPGVLDLNFGLSLDVNIGFEGSVGLEIADGRFEIEHASLAPSVTVGLNGYGEINALLGGAKGGARIAGTLTQAFSAEWINDTWYYRAPGSLSVSGELYYSLLWGLGPGGEFEAFEWQVASWDFLSGEPAPPPPTASPPYTPTSVTLADPFSTDPNNPTLKPTEIFVVSATASNPSSIRERGYQFTTWKESGDDWVSEANWGYCEGADTLGPLADGVYMLQVSAIDTADEVSHSDVYYFEVNAQPDAGSDLSIFEVLLDDDRLHGDDDDVIEGWEEAELDVRLKASSDVTSISATLVSAIDAAEVTNDYSWYGSLDTGEVSVVGESTYEVLLNIGSYSGMPLTLYAEYTRGGIRYYQNLHFQIDVHPQGDYGSYEILGYLVDSDLDGIFGAEPIRSGERVHIKPLLKYEGLATATDSDLTLLATDSRMTVRGERRYPDLSPGESAYPEEGEHAYFTVILDRSFGGTTTVDAQILWDQGSAPFQIRDALEIVVQPTAWIGMDSDRLDLGVVAPGDPLTCELLVYNVGSAALNVNDIVPSHADTTASPTAFSLNPGRETCQMVSVTIDTNEIVNGTRISRDLVFSSDGHPDGENKVTLEALVSNEVPIFQLPSEFPASDADISAPWVVWQESGAIFAYNVQTYEKRQVSPEGSDPHKPRISGDLIVWTDWQNEGRYQRDIYGYELSTGDHFVVSDTPWDEELIGVDNGQVAFIRAYYEFSEATGSGEKYLYNLHLYAHDDGSVQQRTYFPPNSGHNPMQSVAGSSDCDFGGGTLLWERETFVWNTSDPQNPYWDHVGYDNREPPDYWDTLFIWDTRVSNLARPVPAAGTDNNRIVWSAQGTGNDEQVFLWDNGSVRELTNQEPDHGDDALAIGGQFLVYSKEKASWDLYGLYYWDLNGNQASYPERLLTSQVGEANGARMNENSAVWEDQSVSGVFAAFIERSDIAVANLSFDRDDPREGETMEASVVVRNQSAYALADDIVVRLYDGDPDAGGTELGDPNNPPVVSGLAAGTETTVAIPILAPQNPNGEEQLAHAIFARLSLVTGYDNPANNVTQNEVVVHDDDTDGPVISGVRIQEHNGDGDGIIVSGEEVLVSLTVFDSSGVAWVELELDGLPARRLEYPETPTTVMVAEVFPAFPIGTYPATFRASDADNSPAVSEVEETFEVVPAEDMPPIAEDDEYTVQAGAVLMVSAEDGVLANDIDAEVDPLTAIVVDDPEHAQAFELASDGSFNYTAEAGFVGPDSFTYKANDGTSDSGVATARITVEPATTLSIVGAEILEGHGGTREATFVVRLSGPAEDTVTTDYATGDGTAIAGDDYEARSGTLTFHPGQMVNRIVVPVIGDTLVEGDEGFLVELSNVAGATIESSQAECRILDDEGGPFQIVSSNTQFNSVPAGQTLACVVRYDVSDGDNTLTGVALRMHFDSSLLEWGALSQVFSTGLVKEQGPFDDSDDLDGDPATDKYMLVAWADPFGGSWPGEAIPLTLFQADFVVSPVASPGATSSVRFTPSSTPASHALLGEPVMVMVAPPCNLDVDGNGKADALTDGVIILRYLFGFRDQPMIEDVLAPDATRTDPAQITLFLDGGEGTILDVDANGQADALTDGVIILRYLFGFRDEPMVEDCLGQGAKRTDPGEIEAFLTSYMPLAPGVQGFSPLGMTLGGGETVSSSTTEASTDGDRVDAVWAESSQEGRDDDWLTADEARRTSLYHALAYDALQTHTNTKKHRKLADEVDLLMLQR